MAAKTNCVVVRWVRDARNEVQPAYWKGVRNEWVLEYPDAALLSRRDAMKAGRALGANVYCDWGLDSEQALLTLDSDKRDALRAKTGICPTCKQPMEIGDEMPEERICDACAGKEVRP
jgi:hypothetical protein